MSLCVLETLPDLHVDPRPFLAFHPMRAGTSRMSRTTKAAPAFSKSALSVLPVSTPTVVVPGQSPRNIGGMVSHDDGFERIDAAEALDDGTDVGGVGFYGLTSSRATMASTSIHIREDPLYRLGAIPRHDADLHAPSAQDREHFAGVRIDGFSRAASTLTPGGWYMPPP